ncbi:MAG: NAD(P)/FAD-dependent oxidoreductase [Phaeodactylibacter sp.]|uniref:flavin monoamine oxidase family protein n=1 Tax=Phaeodactylibacter sp. TaxID=1940289 RepID=UPI0032EC3E78
MTRKAFIEKALKASMGLPLFSSFLLESCNRYDLEFPVLPMGFQGKVLVVGAGAAGLAAGHLLQRSGIDFEIIEAAPVWGGRMKKAVGFADFPIDLGAEWIHTHPDILSDILNSPGMDMDTKIDFIAYSPKTTQTWNNGRLRNHNYISKLYSEWKFKHTTWFGFFEAYIVPGIESRITLNTPISEVDYSSDRVQLKTTDGRIFEADKVLFTVPVKILQNELISFVPPLPVSKTKAINQVAVGDGIKIFVEFQSRFYPDMLSFGPILKAFRKEEKFVYDAAFGKDSDKNILGLFAINEAAAAYTQLGTESAIIGEFLNELDEIFSGQASAGYVKHIIQNWSAEPYIQGAYSYDFEEKQWRVVEAIQEPVADRLFFAGEALSIDHQATVHGACESAFEAMSRMLAAGQ